MTATARGLLTLMFSNDRCRPEGGLALSFDSTGKMLLLIGGIVVIMGLVLILVGKTPLFGKLPGDIRIETGGFTCLFPFATMIIVSIVLTVLVNLAFRLFSK